MPSLINVESGGNQRAVSGKGATGVAQIMPSTGPEAAKLAGLDWDPARYKNDPKYNEALGHAYLTSMLNRFGDREKAVAAYNAGPGRVSNALLKSQASGRDWRSFLPRETQAYIGKVLGGAQRNLPDRQDPEGADIPGMTFGVDPAFGKGRMAPQYDYMRYSPLLDPSKMQSESSIDKKQQGIAALQAAQDIARMRRGQMGFAEGGPIYLEEGSDGLPISPEQRASFELNEGIRQAQLKEQEDAERKSKEKRDRVGSIFENPALSARRKASSDISESPSDLGYTPTKKKEEEINPDTGKPYTFIEKTKRALDRPSPDLATMIFGTAAERTPQGWAAEEATSPSMFEEPVTPPGWQPPPEKQGGSPRPSGIPSVDKSVGSSPFTGSEPPIGSPARNMAEKGLKALRERDAALGGPDAGGKPMVPGTKPSPKEEADMSFGAVYKQVQDAIGSKVPQELADNMKKHQEALASMKNDKIVDALFAAAKTLAGQRVGQQNFGDAIANAGLAAQEAQKRIYKAEDDMRKYRGDLLKAQDDNNQKAASIAMNRLVHAESDKSAMQRAILQVNKAHETATMQTERYEKMYERQNRADAIRSINAEIIKNTPDPDKVDLQTPEQKRYLEELKRRRDALLSGAEGKTSSPDTGMIPPPPAGFKVK
jgi:hypothetical protein